VDIDQILAELPKAEPMSEADLARFEAWIDHLTENSRILKNAA